MRNALPPVPTASPPRRPCAASVASYESLRVQPATYRLPEDCKTFLTDVRRPDAPPRLWLAKPPCGSDGVQIFVNASKVASFGLGACSRKWRGLMTAHVSK